MTVGEKYNEVRKALAYTGEAGAEAREILAHVLGCGYPQLYLRFFDVLEQEVTVDEIVERRRSGMPLAYATNHKEFYGCGLYVDENVLIPRSDTECVVERAVQLVNEHGYGTALDLCCGSGCMGIALARESTLQSVTFADCSADALGIAKRNAQHLLPGVETRFVQGDLFENAAGKFDIIVCNPPYISEAEYAALEPQVKDYEPQGALLASSDGYAFYERLAETTDKFLSTGGSLVLEIGYNQKERVCQLLNVAGFDKLECGQDLAGRDRWISCERP